MSQFRLTFKLTGSRSAEAEVSANGISYCLFPSLWSCDFGPLALQVIDLLRVSERSEVTISWFEEPSEERWVISRVGDSVTIRIYEFPNYRPNQDLDKGSIVFEAECDILRLATQVKGQLLQLFNEHGEVGYQQMTGVPFPMETLQELTRHIELHKRSSS